MIPEPSAPCNAPRSASARTSPLRAAGFAAVTLLGALAAAGQAAAQGTQSPAQPPVRQVAIQGEGTAAASPDEAVISGGAQIQSRTAKEAMDGNSRAMRQVLEALRAAGIAERDVATSSLSLRPAIEYQSSAGNRPRVVGYTAGHRVEVRVRDLARLGDVLDRMVAAGANQIDGLRLSVSDWSKKVDEARIAAVADARRKAELLARAGGARLGKVISIDEMDAPAPFMRQMAPAPASASEPVPIASGDQTFRMSVRVVWELVD